MPVERRGQVIGVELGPTGLYREEPEGSAEGGSLRACPRGCSLDRRHLRRMSGQRNL